MSDVCPSGAPEPRQNANVKRTWYVSITWLGEPAAYYYTCVLILLHVCPQVCNSHVPGGARHGQQRASSALAAKEVDTGWQQYRY